MNSIEFDPIRHLTDVRRIQALTLQDAMLGGFPNPKEIANPNSPSKLFRQARRIHAAPDNYQAAYMHGKLEGYQKTAEWMIGDELPFATEIEQQRLKELLEQGVSIDPRKRMGIFGLVVSNALDIDTQYEIADGFLDRAVDRALHVGSTAVHIVLHEHDPIKPVTTDHGFVFSGRIGEAAGAPGIPQRLYTKVLDI